MQPTFLVTTQRGHFNLLNSKDVAVSVRVLRPGYEPICFSVDDDHLAELRPRECWSEYLAEACGQFLRRYISTQRDAIESLFEWVKDEANARALDTAQAEQRVAALRLTVEQKQQELRDAEATLASLTRAAA